MKTRLPCLIMNVSKVGHATALEFSESSAGERLGVTP